MSKIKVGSDFSGVGAFDQALMRLGLSYETIFSCDMDKYARQTYIENYGEPQYYPENVYDRDIPKESLDIYMTSPPCQAFSLAGKRKGEGDNRGVLFYNSHEFIVKNRPRFFIFENVKGLLSDDGGKTFQRWIDFLAKSVNGNPMIFPHEESAGYHVYHGVLNSKDYGVPQNRERVFIVGIRDDQDNNFRFPKPQHLELRLKDILEDDVDDKYFLSEKIINGFLSHKDRHEEKGTGFKWQPKTENDIANALRANGALCPTDNSLQVPSATKKGYEEAKEGDSINFSQPNSETRRGGVGKGVAQTLDTACNQGVFEWKQLTERRTEEAKKIRKENMAKGKDFSPRRGKELVERKDDLANTITAAQTKEQLLARRMVGRNPDKPKSRKSGDPTQQQKDNYILQFGDKRLTKTINDNIHKLKKDEPKAIDIYNQKVQDNAPTLTEPHHNTTRLWDGVAIRRLTPRECFRLQDFPDTFKMPCSDTQMYKQAGNSITVGVLAKIINHLSL